MTVDQPAHRPLTRPVLATAALLMIPLVAMQFTAEVVWTAADFVVAGVLLLGTGLMYELAVRRGGSTLYRAAIGAALGVSLFLVWVNLAVGVIGSERNPANAMYLGVLAVGLVGAVLSRLRPAGMARTMYAMAITQGAIAWIAVFARLGGAEVGAVEILGVNGFFVLLFVGVGLLFRQAAREQARADVVPTG